MADASIETDRWVNAEITVTMLLETMDPDAPDTEKQEAVADVMEWISERLAARTDDFVLSGCWKVEPAPERNR